MLSATKCRLYPQENQLSLIYQHFGGTRYIYNRLLKLKIYTYKKYGITLSKYDLKKRITQLKKRKSTSWLKEINSQSLQEEVFSKMDKAYQTFFNGGGFPKFKSRKNNRQSFNIPQFIQFNKSKSKIKLPKIGWMKLRGFNKDIIGKLKTSTLSFENNQFHISLTFEDKNFKTKKNNGQNIGLDMGVTNFVSDSSGKITKPLNLERELTKLVNEQRKLSRKVKGSNNFIKQKIKLNKIHLKIKNKRLDYIHKVSNSYSENQTIVVEDLKIKDMSKNIRGTIENPNKHSKFKSILNKLILQQSWGKFFEILEYKLKRNNGELKKVSPQYTSQECSNCHVIDKKHRKGQKYKCSICGFEEHADINAANNILGRDYRNKNAYSKIVIMQWSKQPINDRSIISRVSQIG